MASRSYPSASMMDSRHFMTNKNQLIQPDDLKGQRIQYHWSGSFSTESLANYGSNSPISMSWGEVYNGIQSKGIRRLRSTEYIYFPSKIYKRVS